MKTIHKYACHSPYEMGLSMPKDARIVHVGEQNGNLNFWAEVETDADQEMRWFQIFGTGHPITYSDQSHPSYQYIGTVQVQNGLVWHLYEVIK